VDAPSEAKPLRVKQGHAALAAVLTLKTLNLVNLDDAEASSE